MDKINSLKYESRNFELYINGKKQHVFDTPVLFDGLDETRMIFHPYFSSYASFEIEETAEVMIKTLTEGEISAVKIQPKTKQYEISGVNVKFFIKPGEKLSITVNGKINHTLMLFANLPIAVPEDGDVIYFGPGEHYITDNEHNILYLKSNQTLYLAEGAVLHGRLEAKNAENIRITGNGIICGSYTNGRWAEWLRPMVGSYEKTYRKVLTDFIFCKNIKIENVTFVDADEWNVRILGCENIDVSEINIIGYQLNSDGVDICSSRNASLKDSFIRTSDDCIVIKTKRELGETKNVNITGCTVWADRANALEIGHELCCDISEVHFSDIDILNQVEETYGYHAIDITNVDEGNVYNIFFDNIRIEECRRLVGIRIREGRFSSNEGFCGNGTVHDVYFNNIYSKQKRTSFISGRNEDRRVSAISFKDFFIGNEKITDFEDFVINPYTENITIEEHTFDGYPKYEDMKILDIRPMCNMLLGENRGIYGIQHKDWTTMPSGVKSHEGIPFEIIGQGYAENGGNYKRCVVPKNRIRIEADTVLNTDFKANRLFFLHTGINILSEIDKALLKYKITYEDESTAEIIIKNQNDCNEWNTWSLGGWQPVYNSIRMYIKTWKNPYPEKTIKRIELFDGELNDLGILLGITYV